MTANNLQPVADAANEASTRDNRLLLSLTDEDLEQLKGLIPNLERRLDRKVVPLSTAAYHVFLRGLELERAS